jgi:tryptophan halogenase
MKITIVGGGTAGWITAFKLKKKIPSLDVTVIESSKIPIIGVGEGSTGKLTDILNDPDLGLDEFDFMQQTWALPKYGILFSGWDQTGSKQFYSPIEGSVTEAMPLDLFVYNSILQDEDVAQSSVSGFYYKDRKVPWFVKEGNLHYIGGRAYHIDAYKVGEFFKSKSIIAGVQHIDAKVENVTVHENKINSLSLDNGKTVSGDLFIDCSGFAKVLMSRLKNDWIDRTDQLPVNTGLIFKPKKDSSQKTPYTSANAKNNGWIFEIPTRHKIGRGYIYCDRYATQKDIISEIESEYGPVDVVQEIKFQAGVYKDFWVENCMVFGLSSGFLEPLQATSLHVTLCQLEKLVRDILVIDQESINNEFIKKDFNSYCSSLTTDMLDFVQATYTGGREDTDFWKYVTHSTKKSEKLKTILYLAKNRLIRSQDFQPYDGYAGQALWVYTLAGLGHFDKETIKKVLTSMSIDMDQLNIDHQIFKDQMNSTMGNKLTCDQLNDIMLRGEELKLEINKVY